MIQNLVHYQSEACHAYYISKRMRYIYLNIRLLHIKSQDLGPKSLEVNPCNLKCWDHRSWYLPLHMGSQVLSPKYDMDAYMITLFGGETWDSCEGGLSVSSESFTTTVPCGCLKDVKHQDQIVCWERFGVLTDFRPNSTDHPLTACLHPSSINGCAQTPQSRWMKVIHSFPTPPSPFFRRLGHVEIPIWRKSSCGRQIKLMVVQSSGQAAQWTIFLNLQVLHSRCMLESILL